MTPTPVGTPTWSPNWRLDAMSSTYMKACPFCGGLGTQTGEHVWAQWMHDTPGALALLEGTHGERMRYEQSRLHLGADGRYEHERVVSRHVAKWLPNVKVKVCETCNTGWMSALESSAKAILSPLVLEGHTYLRLSADDLVALATWATKSWMAYALLRLPHQNPFTTDEYRSMAADPMPLGRSQVWLMHSRDPGAHVSMSLESSLASNEANPIPDLVSAQDNWAYGLVAVNSVVLFIQVLPPDAPIGMADVMVPRFLSEPRLARQIWPDQRPQFYPLQTLPPGALGTLVRYGRDVFDAVGLPTVGLNRDDGRAVLEQFRQGADPIQLRRDWNQPG